MPQKLTTTACFIQEESSGGKQFRKHVSCFYAQGGNVGVLSKRQLLAKQKIGNNFGLPTQK